MENKKQITEALLPVLQMTKYFTDLDKLEYRRNDGNEDVVATFVNGWQKVVNVSCDSGIAMISDIIRQLRE